MAIDPTPDPTYALAKPLFNWHAGKCDGDHGMPECSSRDCWHRDPPIDVWQEGAKWRADLPHRTRPEWADTTTPANHPRPQLALASLMSQLSERCYYAGWLIGIEEILWDVTAELRDHDRGQDTVLEFEVHWLRALAVAAGGWIEWRDGDGPDLDGHDGLGPRFVAWQTQPPTDGGPHGR